MGGGSKAQKDKPEGPSHTPGRGWACPCSPPSRAGFGGPSAQSPTFPWGGGDFGEGGVERATSCGV